LSRFLYIALSDPLPGREQDLDDWYDRLHLAQVIDVPGFISARRYVAIEAGDGPPRKRKALVIYEIEADVPAEVIAGLRNRRGTELLIPSDALDPATMFAQVYQPVGETLYSEPQRASTTSKLDSN
jgi:hypothetical protein